MDSIDYHMLAAFRYEVSILNQLKDEFDSSEYHVIVDYMKARINELERKFKES